MPTTVFSFTLNATEVEQLRSLANARGISISALIRVRLRYRPQQLVEQGRWADWKTVPYPSQDGEEFGDQWSASDE